MKWPASLVAFWDFHQDAAEFAPALGGADIGPLQVCGGAPRRMSAGPFGHAVVFNGRDDALGVAVDQIGSLNVGAVGDSVSVLAWIKRTPSSECHFVAGIWVEDDRAPKRQYGLFVDLPVYGGADRVCGHVSRTGGPSPGLPFSRDYSASARTVSFDRWQLAGFTYDGVCVTSYLDGVADTYRHYTEPPPPLGLGLGYPKNPYRIPEGCGLPGLNGAPAEFTVGAVQLSDGPGNHFAGAIGGLAVFDRALTSDQIRLIAEHSPCPSSYVTDVRARGAWGESVDDAHERL
ncbi:hypothetical protein ACIP5Y_39715 [Nocardia sp. NPDC088792]|uniref:hypothetical protein n=1 Tax=Nocardia sp. NPDC088792 TaxID=3364332 RepID=UPI0037F967A9